MVDFCRFEIFPVFPIAVSWETINFGNFFLSQFLGKPTTLDFLSLISQCFCNKKFQFFAEIDNNIV